MRDALCGFLEIETHRFTPLARFALPALPPYLATNESLWCCSHAAVSVELRVVLERRRRGIVRGIELRGAGCGAARASGYARESKQYIASE